MKQRLERTIAIRAITALAITALAIPGAANATDPPPDTDATVEALRLDAQHAYRVEVTEGENQDPVVFTDISPYTTDETPVRLPADQSLD